MINGDCRIEKEALNALSQKYGAVLKENLSI